MKKKNYIIPKKLTSDDIRMLRMLLAMTQQELADFIGVSKKTVERWESGIDDITGPVVLLYQILKEQTQLPAALSVPEKALPVRMYYMYRREVCTLIDADERTRTVMIRNYTDRLQYRAFGPKEKPDYQDFEAFLESRCFPRNRDGADQILKELGLPFYDPLLIIEKTQGRLVEDDFWIRIGEI